MSYPKAGNLNGSNADMCSSSSGAGDLFELLDRSNETIIFTISPTTSTTGGHLGFERDFNSHTAFRSVLRHYA